MSPVHVYRPMATAPTDGTVVLVLLPHSDIPHAARFEKGKWLNTWDHYQFTNHDSPIGWLPLPGLAQPSTRQEPFPDTPSAAREEPLPLQVTPQAVEDVIAHEYYFTALQGVDGSSVAHPTEIREELGLVTFCVLLLKNGFKTVGYSCCVCPELFDEEKGRNVARDEALNQIYTLLGYDLKQQYYQSRGVK